METSAGLSSIRPLNIHSYNEKEWGWGITET